MTILRESPWYQQILREESHRLVFKLIERRFGDISSPLRLKIQQLSVSQSEDLATDLLDITQINQLETWLQEKTNQN
jgi:predicted transposase YdaD